MAAKGTVTVKLLGDNKDLNSKLGAAEGKLSKFATDAAKYGALAAAAVGVAVVKLGVDLDKALDNIIVGTGASGVALQGLQNDFEAVASTVPASFNDVSTAIADLNTRLGLTGEPLQAMATQFLDVSRLTGTDLTSNIANMTRVFGDAGIAAEDQSAALDLVFTASQASGISMDQLSTTLVSAGAPMRALGFTFEESTALLAKFDQEGVNTEAVLSGMRTGLGKMAQAGEDPIDTFDRITESIASAGTAGEANAIALEAFGQRAGPDMAAAIREGRFEIDDMLEAITGSEGAISDTAAATESWTEKLKILTNKTMMKLAPVAEFVFDKIERAVDAVTPYVETLTEWFEENIPKAIDKIRPTATQVFDAVRLAIAGVVNFVVTNWPKVMAAIMPVFNWLMNNKSVIVGALAGIGFLFGVVAVQAGLAAASTVLFFAPVIALVAGMMALGAAVFYAYENFEWFRNAVDAAWQFIQRATDAFLGFWKGTAWPLIKDVIGLIVDGFQRMVEFVKENWHVVEAAAAAFVAYMKGTAWPFLQEIIGFIVDEFKEMVGFIRENWDQIKDAISNVLTFLKIYYSTWIAVIVLYWKVFGDTILSYVSFAWSNIKILIIAALDIIKGIIKTVISVITGDWKGAWEGIKMILSAVWVAMRGIVTGAIEFVWGQIKRVLGLIGSNWRSVWNGLSSFTSSTFSSIAGFVSRGISDIIGFIAGLPGKVVRAVGSGFAGLWESFKKYANKIVDGWNGLSFKLPEIDTKIPGVGKIGGFSVGTPNIPRFHSGGFVGNPSGSRRDVPAMLQQGEFVLRSDDVDKLMGGGVLGGGGGGTPVHLHLADGVTIRGMFDKRDAELLAELNQGALV
jgi:phage-related minor tail protein